MKMNVEVIKFRHLTELGIPFLRENGKIIAQFLLTALFIALAIWFFKHEESELSEVRKTLFSAKWEYVLAGISVTVIHIWLQGYMYRYSFAAVRSRIPIPVAVLLFLKRNFISVFIPAGGVSSLAFFSGEVERTGVSKSKIHFASSIYAFVGVLSVLIVAIPVFIYAMAEGVIGSGEWFALGALAGLIYLFYFIYHSVMGEGKVYKLIIRYFPASEVFMQDLISNTIDRKSLVMAVVVSVIIDLTGAIHLYIAMLALNFSPTIFIALLGYLVAVLFLVISPFMRGLGAVEFSMAYVLMRFGFSQVEAISITFLYRFFEFWLTLLMGGLSFLIRINKLLMRIIPALLIFALGLINVISVFTPAIDTRLEALEDFLPLDAITASNYFVALAGVFMLLTAAFMFKGLRTAWWIAIALSIVSAIGHLTKAIDYEEAIAALLVLVMLVYSRKEYYIRSNPRLRFVGFTTAFASIVAVLVYGIVGFYFLDKKHFDIDFNHWQSVRYTIQNYFIVGSSDLIPRDEFARHFLLSINISGLLSMSFLFYAIVSPYVYKRLSHPEEREKAQKMISDYGKSAMDYFKCYPDKLFFVPEELNAFLAYRIAGNYAVVLEDPVAENEEQLLRCIRLFDNYCYENGLKSFYYRVPTESLGIYKKLHKKYLFLGQEGVVDVNTFTLEGGSRKPMRNAVNKVIERGYKSTIHTPPIKDGVLQKLRAVSDEWLNETGRSEIIFSQGMFIWEELKQQTIITVESPEEKIVAFLNVIPDYAKEEATYDLIRKTLDAPNGVMDFILIELFKYVKSQQLRYVNLGFAPLSGIESPQNITEESMKFAYEKVRTFSHYKGLRDYKEKFSPVWYNKYLIYDHDYDLLQVPAVLSKVIKP
ncbi:phosphatidylglycerol lysyltransferase domain-containing protein [Parabacteroides sp. FAFU027]|uniref:phosphatidylglycerol lysyltransferase domain-containing protein n=1 Tax=Parabacteroides sp. FAFU027 TaxID=2922715 RepID=UPI001FAE7D1F|nr:phosphatidylglycerol lysyltransferase domain-containing protein [Parabacteroides sp. FAFU027]